MDSLKLEFWMIVSNHVGAGNQSEVVFNHWAIYVYGDLTLKILK